MLRILSRVTTSLWVHFALFCGACLFVATPLVIWPHIHGYLLAMIFILAAFERFLVYQEKGQDKDLSWMALFLTVGSFFYEFGVVFSGIGFGWTMWETWRKKIEWNGRGRKLALAYLIPICVYLTVNFVDFLWHRATIQSLDSYTVHLTAFLSLAGFLKFMDQCLAVIGTFFMATFFPVFLDIQMEMNPRIMLPEVAGFIRKIPYFYNAGNVLAFMSLAGFLIFQLFRKKISNRDGHPTESSLSKQAAFSIFCFSVVMFFAYVVSITAGRLFVSGMDYLDRSYYYFYFLFVFAFLACVSGCCMMRSCGKAFPIPLWVRISLVLSGLLLVIVNGVFVRAYNLGLEKMFAGEYDYMLDLESFVREHRAEPDFSFQMIYRSADDRIKIVVGKDKKVMDVNANDMIFSRYVDFKNPKYHLVYRDGRLNVFLTKEQAFEFLNDVKAGVL